jgi:hypothetical protein
MNTLRKLTKAGLVSLTAGLISMSAAVGGEGSADIGPQPPYGYYAGERGSPPGDYGRSAPFGSPDQRHGRTLQQQRSRW